jgi:hypothetical protein
MWFRRRAKIVAAKPFDSSMLPPHAFLTVEEATEEGLLLAEYASRMAVKNRFIKKILTDKQPWFLEHSRDDARTALAQLATETDLEVEYLSGLITKFRLNPNSERDSQGYSYDDLENMEHRKEVSENVGRELRKQMTDADFLTHLVDSARKDAWREIAANIENNLDIENLPRDADYERHRDDRMRALIDEDLAALLTKSPGTTPMPAATPSHSRSGVAKPAPVPLDAPPSEPSAP